MPSFKPGRIRIAATLAAAAVIVSSAPSLASSPPPPPLYAYYITDGSVRMSVPYRSYDTCRAALLALPARTAKTVFCASNWLRRDEPLVSRGRARR